MPIHVVGLGLDPENLPETHSEVVDSAHVLVGGARLLESFDDHPAEKLVIACPLEKVITEIGERENEATEVVVLADGDPLFYGIGARLVDAFGPESVRILPNVTTLQVAASRLKIPWQDVVTVSLHGREGFHALFTALQANEWVAVLTDARNIPSAIAQALEDKAGGVYSMWVFEDLETERERFERYTLAEAGRRTFSSLNVVLLERTGAAPCKLRLGIPDEEFATDRGVFTKGPARAVCIAELRLMPGDVMWDLGAGSGGVSVEAASLNKGPVYAVEKNADRVALIRENVSRFGALNVEAVYGVMPACLADLPDPDKIFLGGGLAGKSEILPEILGRLRPGGRLVANCALLGSLSKVKQCLESMGWPLSVTLVQAAQSRELAGDLHMEAVNPIFVVAADKPEKKQRKRR
jgi:precorrin-6B C5,15-methyltransferase / cobalt-precorrin-6B C5,C15-methyltransferase